jgi:hypothetical protein
LNEKDEKFEGAEPDFVLKQELEIEDELKNDKREKLAHD